MLRNNKSFLSRGRKLYSHITKRRKFQLSILVILMIIGSLAEVISIGAVVPFLGVLIAPESIFNNPSFSLFITYFEYDKPNDLIFPITIIFIFASILSALIRILMTFLNTKLAFRIGVDFSIKMFGNSMYQPYSTHVNENSSEIINTITAKATNTIFNFLMPILIITSSSILVFAIIYTLAYINPLIAIYSFGGIGIIYILISRIASSTLRYNGILVADQTTKVIKTVQESLGGIRDIILDSNQKTFIDIFASYDKSLRNAQGNNAIIMLTPRYLLEGLSLLVIAVVAYSFSTGGNLENTVPVLGAVALGAQKVLPHLQGIYGAWSQIRSGEAILDDALFLLDQKIKKTDSLQKEIYFDKNISINNISFGYGGKKDQYVIKNFSHVIKKGSRTGIIGSTGTGKSTLVDIIMGLLQPSLGNISIDDKEINENNMHIWRSKIAHVPQSIFLTDSSISENIAFGNKKSNIDYKKLQEVVEQSQLTDFINSLPDGLNTNVGERGVKLSGGQRQRIGIARALYKNAELIIFDEATSALDTATEKEIMKSIENLSNHLTLIIIAHRLSTLEQCDEILDLSSKKDTNKVK